MDDTISGIVKFFIHVSLHKIFSQVRAGTKYWPGRPELHAGRIKCLQNFYFTRRTGNLTRKYYIGIREHAGTDLIVSPGRPDIWRKCIAGYELIKIYISSGKPDI